LDEEAILKSLAKQNASLQLKSIIFFWVVCVSVLALNSPAPEFAVNDSFGESGTPEQLMDKPN
jgi:hypothetical protein